MLQKLVDNHCLSGVLALSPFFIVISSFSIAIYTGLTVFLGLLLIVMLSFLLRTIVPETQRQTAILVISVSVIIIAGMTMSAEAYRVYENLGFYFPLLLINGLVLTTGEKGFSLQNINQALISVMKPGFFLLVFLLTFSFLRLLLDELSLFSSAAGCFLIVGFLFAGCNYLTKSNYC